VTFLSVLVAAEIAPGVAKSNPATNTDVERITAAWRNMLTAWERNISTS
jgi:hypothetical protein